jgi:hypothetical protein
MSGPRLRLTAELHVQIVASIRAGGFGYVAAQAWGVSKKVYERWLAWGQSPSAREPYRSFAGEVAAAEAQARLRAETRTFEHDGKFWLERGPARDRPGNQGWGRTGKQSDEAMSDDKALLASPAFWALGRKLRMICKEKLPEAADVFAQAEISDGSERPRRRPHKPPAATPPSAPPPAPPPDAATNATHPSANGSLPPRAA